MIITYPGSLLLMTAYPMTVQYVGFMFEGSVKGFVTELYQYGLGNHVQRRPNVPKSSLRRKMVIYQV